MGTYANDTNNDEPGRGGWVALAFCVLSVVALSLPDGVHQQLASFTRGTVLRPFVMTQEGLVRLRVHAVEAEVLQQQLDSLASVLPDRTTLREENARLRRLLNLSTRLSADWVAANVIRPGIPGAESMFLLDAGSRRGVVTSSPVITGRGLLGVVRESSPRNSIGIDWTHSQFRASAMTPDGSVYGFVQAIAGPFREADRLLLDGIPFHQALAPGTVLVTSALSGVYPRGIPIGAVIEEAESRAGWRRSYWLRPFVSPGEATHVLVLLPSSAEFDDATEVWARGGLREAERPPSVPEGNGRDQQRDSVEGSGR